LFGCNRVKLSGILQSIEKPGMTAGFISVTGVLLANKGFLVQLFATGRQAVKELTFFRPGDSVVVIGSLSRSPRGELQICAVNTTPITQPPRVECTQRMDLANVHVSDRLRAER